MISTCYVLMLLSILKCLSSGENHTDNAVGLSHAQIWADPTHLQYTEFSLLVYRQNIA